MLLRPALLLLILLLPGCFGNDDVRVTATEPLLMPSYAYDGRGITRASGELSLRVDANDNSGTLVATARDAFHAYEVRWASFQARAPYQSGGIATNLDLWGDSGNGSAVFPKMKVYVAAFGTAHSFVDGKPEKDPTSLEDHFNAIAFITRGRHRDPETLRIEDSEKLRPYDPSRPQDAYINQIGAQAVILLYTQRGDLLRHFDFQDVRVNA